MINFDSVTKRYSEKITALENATFEVKEGEFVFLVGASGAGKSTIIRLLVQEELPTSGSIQFMGDEVTRMKKHDLVMLRRSIGVVFQDFKLINSFTIRENIEFALEAADKSEKDIKETAQYVLDLVGIADRSELFPVQLSGGEKQKASIARAMATNPKLLIADEPTGNLDPSSTWDIVQLLNKINNWGTTVLMATHDEDIVDSLQKRVIELEGGKIIRDDKSQGKYSKKNDKDEAKKSASEPKSNSKKKLK